MPGWIGYPDGGCPYWFGTDTDAKHLVASVEPSGLQFSGEMQEFEFIEWINTFIEKATQVLSFQVMDTEDAED